MFGPIRSTAGEAMGLIIAIAMVGLGTALVVTFWPERPRWA